MKTLVIAEKPDMGRNIAAAIDSKTVNKRTYIEGESYVVTWAIGHLVGLAEPDRYNATYKKWRFSDLPILPERFLLLPHERTKAQLGVIADLAKRCGQIINACDAGREGQLIFTYIYQHLKLKHPVKRLWISDLTKDTIRRGFNNLKDNAEYASLTAAARSRSEADWLIGMNGSRAFSTKHHMLLSVGRVQTPVLALIFDRRQEIDAFRSQKYFVVEAQFQQRQIAYKGFWQGERITDPDKAEELCAKIKGKQGRVSEYTTKETQEFPLKLYDLTLLQREANAKYGFSAKKTLDIAQLLYEKHQAITYPRTNSNYVTEQNIAEMHRVLDRLKSSADYAVFVADANKKFVHVNNKNICNPDKVEDHHAILPTLKLPGHLTSEQQKVYDLVVRRFLSQFYAAARYRIHTLITEVEQETFKTTVKQQLDLGWKIVYAAIQTNTDNETQDEVETDQPFGVRPDQPVECRDATAKQKQTQPPKPFTEGTLLKAMESAGKQIEDEQMREAMKDSGLGTPATRAATIERLKQVGYIEMKGKKVEITEKGITAIQLIRGAGVGVLTSPEMTGRWEQRLNEIARGQASPDVFMDNVRKFAALIVNKLKGAETRH